MSDDDPPSPEPAAELHGLDAGELLARGLHTVKPSVGASPWEPPAPEELGRLLPQYRVESLIGRGGMGAVYKAIQINLDRPVAIKLLPEEMAADQEFVTRFEREARTLAKLQHSRIISIYDVGRTNAGHLYFVMEYIDGTDLRHILKGPGLDPEQALLVVGQLCDALQAAHREGIVHRDVKPENVLISRDGYVKLADFGLARPPQGDGASVLTQTNFVVGTPDYMAPEQHTGATKTDHRSDIFSLGVMFYEILTGQPPRGVFDPPSHKVHLDVRIDEVVLKALQSEPDRRYQKVSEMKTDVDRIRATPLPSASSVNPSAATTSKGKAARTILLATAIVALLVGTAGYFFWRGSERHSLEQSSARQNSTPSPGTNSALAVRLPAKSEPVPFAENAAPAPLAQTMATGTLAAPIISPARPSTPQPLASATTPQPASEVEKWLAQVDGSQQESFQKQVVKPFENGMAELRTRYLASLDAAIAKASAAGQLTEALAWRAERQAFVKAQNVAADEAATLPGVKALRTDFRQQLARFNQNRAVQAKTLLVQYDAILAKYQTLLVQHQRLDEALLLKVKRDEIAGSWSMPANPLVASKTAPLVNSLGQEFVPVPGTEALFCRWDTRVKDYAAYARANKVDDAWTRQEFGGVPVSREPDYPVVGVSWNDAKAFCQWLTEKENAERTLPPGMKYRLPTDEEWSWAVGLPPELGATPAEKSERNSMDFPWGKDYPPTRKVGNYADETLHAKFPNEPWIAGYKDGYPTTSPVGSFAPTEQGLYDMGGNVWQWCEDWLDASHKDRVVRGASWINSAGLLSSHRLDGSPGHRIFDFGFRCVLAPASGATPAVTVSAPVSTLPTSSAAARSSLATATKDQPFVNLLGMQFVPVPILGGPTGGQRVLFSVWDTRVRDYAAYAGAKEVDDAWTKQQKDDLPVGREWNHPVVGVSFEDAQGFCQWLTEKEMAEGKLTKGLRYRLPTDEEWSWAVGLPTEAGATPKEKSGHNSVDFPWGKNYPSTEKVGNYADEVFHGKFPKDANDRTKDQPWIKGYTDGYATTSPVASFPANAYGLYDMGGNVCQWCDDWFDASHLYRVQRGCSWHGYGVVVFSAFRNFGKPSGRQPTSGFRCVLAPASGATPAAVALAPASILAPLHLTPPPPAPLLPPVSTPHADDNILTLAESNAGWRLLFNGKNLNGWKGSPDAWSVEDGAITMKNAKEHQAREDLPLIWQGGVVSDFELTYKSRVRPTEKTGDVVGWFLLRGRLTASGNVDARMMQVFRADSPSGFSAWRPWGVKIKVSNTSDPRKPLFQDTGSIIDLEELRKVFKKDDWNDHKVIAVGNTIRFFCAGKEVSETLDESNTAEKMGHLALKMYFWSGPGVMQIKDIKLRRLSVVSLMTMPGEGSAPGASTR